MPDRPDIDSFEFAQVEDISYDIHQYIDHGGDSTEDDGSKGDGSPLDESSALGPPRHIEVTIIGQDPKVLDANGEILRAKVRVAADRFRPPFQTHRFNVVSFEPRTAGPGPALKLLDGELQYRDRFATVKDSVLLTNTDFHAQNVFAIASRTLSAFEAALGRRVPWDFEGHQLFLVPHGEIKANARYSPSNKALVFGLVPKEDGSSVYSCLAHDIVAHETSHAILDGLRPGFFNPALPDQGAFHEGFADAVALLSVFALPEVLEHALRQVHDNGMLTAVDATRKKLEQTVLFRVAEQFGEVVHGRPDRPLRESVRLRPGDWWRKEREFELVHKRGEVLVAAVSQTLLQMWLGRLKALLEDGPAPLPLAAEEGAKSAQHLLTMLIRAIDYTPPVEFEFEDFVDAIRWSDMQMAPDDKHGYRDAVLKGFARHGIGLPKEFIVNVNKLKVQPRYDRFNFAALRSDKDEVFRFIWENDELLRISLDFQTDVEAIHPSIRVGPDGFVVHETVVTYVQQLDATVGELETFSSDPANRYRSGASDDDPKPLAVPRGVDPDKPIRIFGGGSIIFDQFGRPKFHQHKPLLDWARQSERLKFLARTAKTSPTARLGVTSFGGLEPIAALHRSDPLAVERW